MLDCLTLYFQELTLHQKETILVIKHGALGDFILATSMFSAVRAYHPKAHIVLLTTDPFVRLAQKTEYFDEVWVDPRAPFWNLKATLRMRHLMRGGDAHYVFRRIYDFQASQRTDSYFRFLKTPKPQWIGKAKGCSHPRSTPDGVMHSFDMHQTHLQGIGFPELSLPNVDWMQADLSVFDLPERFVLLVPGCSPLRPKKRWTPQGYCDVIRHFSDQGITSVIIGSNAEMDFVQTLESKMPDDALLRNLVGKTSLEEIGVIAREACFVIGNDTGPMHIIAAAGCPGIVLFSSDSTPKLHGPPGKKMKTIQVDDLAELPSSRVIEAIALV